MSDNREHLRISWRAVALSSLLLNLGAIATVVAISSVQDAGALNTVALALAVIAFICQLIIYSVQTWQSGQQLQEARELNASTRGLISEARTRIEGTHQMVTSQYQEFVHLIALKAGTEAIRSVEAGEIGPADVVSEAAARSSRSEMAPPPWWSEVAPGDVPMEVVQWPQTAQEAKSSVQDLELVTTAGQLTNFVTLAADDVGSTVAGLERGLRHIPGLDDALIEAGLASRARAKRDGTVIIVMTSRGRRAIANLVAPWPPPESFGISGQIQHVRSTLDARASKELESIKENTGAM